ncbi:MAG: peptidylprolyl isomerase [Clostridia bacterium]|nr:peptidylprolyl isomerase [Clostridia bacterium]
MKKQILSFACGAVFALGLVMVPAVADSISKSINVLVDYVTVTLDGEAVDVSNFVHEGRTYLGLRDMGNLLGLQVDWDDETQTAILTSPGKTPVWPVHKQTIDVPIAKETSITINGNKIDSSWINETYNNYKTNYPSAAEDEIKNAVVADATWYAFQQEMYAKYDIKETDDFAQDAEKSYLEFVEMYGGAESFEQVLTSSGYELDSHKKDYIKGFIETQMMNQLTDCLIEDSEEIQKLKSGEKANFEQDASLAVFPKATVKHILIPTGDNAKKNAEKVLERLKKGESFDKVLAEFKENDPGMPTSGYEVSKDSGFVPEFEEAALKLTKGKFSDIVKSDYGYHIIYCLEKSETITFDEYFEMNFNNEVSQILNNIVQEYEKTAEVKVEWGF